MTELPMRPDEEVWESLTDSTIWVQTTDARGRESAKSIQGKGRKLRLRTLDRQIAQEQNPESNPFTNGMLRRIDVDQNDDPQTESDQVFSDEDLKKMFRLNRASLQNKLPSLNEMNVRRLRELVDDHGSVAQKTLLEEYYERNLRKGGEMPSYQDIKRT